MKERDAAGDEPTSPVEGWVAACLEQFEREGDPALEEVCRAHPEHADEIRARVRALQELGIIRVAPAGAADTIEPGVPGARVDDDDAPPPSDQARPPERLGEYRLIRRVGQGGMGVVYLGQESSGDRLVAIKIVRPDQLFFGNARRRFRREVEAIARLNHPNIVPVYSVGEDRGVPYYAMEYVVGSSLDRIVATVRKRVAARLSGHDFREALKDTLLESPGRTQPAWNEAFFQGSWWEVCLRVMARVADALEHAHGRGVIHRDIKLANMMVTPEGRVLLLDFGLANLRGESRFTRTGTQLGSLPYMPPEHVGGTTSRFSPASDVYSAGVSLYALLALRLPYQSEFPERVRQMILEARPRPLRSCNPQLSPDLETVCAVAMDPEPGRRFASAGDLALDLRNVLASRPIAARPAGPMLRLRRWARRRPATALALVVAFAGPLGLGIQRTIAARDLSAVNTELIETNVALEESLGREREELRRSDAHLEVALKAINTVLALLGDEALINVPEAQTVRTQAIDEGIRLVDSLMAARPDDRRVRREWAILCRRRGDLLGEHERPAEALVEYARHLEWFSGQFADDPGDVEARAELAVGLHQQAIALLAVDRPREALRAFAESRDHWGGLAGGGDRPDATLRQRVAATTSMAQILLRWDRGAEAVAMVREVLEESRAAAELHPADPEVLAAAAQACEHLGGLLPDLSSDECNDVRGESARWYRQLVGLIPRDRAAREGFAVALMNHAASLETRGEAEAARARVEEARQILAGLIRDYPHVASFRRHLAEVFNNLGSAHAYAREHEQARGYFERSIREYRILIDRDPEQPELRAALTLPIANAAHGAMHAGDSSRAIEEVEEVFELLEPLLAREPDRADLRGRWVLAATTQACSQFRLGSPEEAAVVLEEASEWSDGAAWESRLIADAWNEGALAARAAGDGEFERDCVEEMWDHLDLAIELGYADLEELLSTPTLDPYREDERFGELVARIERLRR